MDRDDEAHENIHQVPTVELYGESLDDDNNRTAPSTTIEYAMGREIEMKKENTTETTTITINSDDIEINVVVDVELGALSSADENDNQDDIMQERRASDGDTIVCPLTNLPYYVDPVVASNGHTYEREALRRQQKRALVYPNRALKEYSDFKHANNNGVQAPSPLQVLKKGFFHCPITCDLLRDPVIDPDGNTYEHHAIVDWIHKHGTSPITRQPLVVRDLYDNTILVTILLQEIQRAETLQGILPAGATTTADEEEEDHKAIQAWKQDCSRLPPQPQQRFEMSQQQLLRQVRQGDNEVIPIENYIWSQQIMRDIINRNHEVPNGRSAVPMMPVPITTSRRPPTSSTFLPNYRDVVFSDTVNDLERFQRLQRQQMREQRERRQYLVIMSICGVLFVLAGLLMWLLLEPVPWLYCLLVFPAALLLCVGLLVGTPCCDYCNK